MNRTEFEALRDLQGKVIRGDIRFSQRRATHPSLVAEDVRIENDAGADLRMNVTHNPEVGSTSINVSIPGTGSICRLDVDGTKHRDAGRCHKHSVQTECCPDRNLPDGAIPRAELSRKPVRLVFETFCADANIEHLGAFEAPDESPAAAPSAGPTPVAATPRTRNSSEDDGAAS